MVIISALQPKPSAQAGHAGDKMSYVTINESAYNDEGGIGRRPRLYRNGTMRNTGTRELVACRRGRAETETRAGMAVYGVLRRLSMMEGKGV